MRKYESRVKVVNMSGDKTKMETVTMKATPDKFENKLIAIEHLLVVANV